MGDFMWSSAPALQVQAPREDISMAICPRCLREMIARSTRPAAAIYVEGVRCDYCSVELVTGRGLVKGFGQFFHCGRCWFDLCRNCANRDMQEVWWADRINQRDATAEEEQQPESF